MSAHPEEVSSDDDLVSDVTFSVNRYHFGGFALKIKENTESYVGSHVWKAGIVLCEYFEKEKISFAGKKVIELGSGTGIVGILAVLLGGDVTFTDKSFILKRTKQNISANLPPSCKKRTKVCVLSWGDDQKNFPSNYDVILGADIVYCRSAYPFLLQTLKHLSNEMTTIYISSEMRPNLVSSIFHEKQLPPQFNYEIVHRKESENIVVYKLTKK
ncbi:EEF1A lysine methyltransferase 3-like [Callorhinchus milii]|uniref:Uncharacterized protein n=1 Tax=Callorhinchus milii TaxID=7868 RepID=V9L928_CALMI|nr:EEF1A lysine methyltransferase 3-like [Callorhinchus milii]XP_042194201.1 EEF1A lysine methyltransferase 3-like [Callorhinchus milii]